MRFCCVSPWRACASAPGPPEGAAPFVCSSLWFEDGEKQPEGELENRVFGEGDRPVLLSSRFTSRQERRARQKPSPARCQRVVPGACVLFAVCCLFLVHPQRVGAGNPGMAPATTILLASAGRPSGMGKGAGGVGSSGADARLPVVPTLCNPFDTNCFATGVASWMATQIQQALQPVADQILQNPSNIISQTPLLQGESLDTPLLNLNTLFIGVIDTALACLLVIGAYNTTVSHHLGVLHASMTELIPRAVLVIGAVHFNQAFLADFINLENALSLAVVHAVGLKMLTNILAGLFTNMLADGPLVFILLVVLAIMVLLLLIQMIVRLALVALCVATAPLGLGCLMLPQSMRWGRLWLTLFASSVMVQFLQVVALGLGGVFITAIASTSLVRLDVQLATAFLAIGTLYLVLKIPGILQNWALHPMMEGFSGGRSTTSQGSQSSQTSVSGGGSGSGATTAWADGGGGSTAVWEDAGASGSMMEGHMMAGADGGMLLLF